MAREPEKARRPGKVKITEVRELEEPEPLEEDRRSDEDQRQLDEFLEDTGPGTKTFKLYRRNRESGKLAYCEVIPRGVFSEEYVRNRWGGGLYQARMRGESNEPMGSRMFEVEGEPANPKAADVAARAAAVVAPGADPMEMATRMTQMIMGAVTAALGAMRPATAERDPIELLRTAKELFAPTGPPVSPMEVWQAGVKVGRTLENGEGDSYAGVLRDALPVVGELAKAMAGSRQPERPMGPLPVRAALTDGAGAPEGPAPVDMRPIWLRALWPFLPLVGGLAAAEFQADAAATQLLAKMPDDVYEDVATDSEREGFVNRTLALMPNALVAPHGAWLARVLAAMAEQIADAEAEGDDKGPQLVTEVHEGSPPAEA